MALEDLTGPNKYLNALVPTNPLGADDRREGDDHIRGIKNVLLNTFGALSGPVNMETQYVDAAGDTMTGALTLPSLHIDAADGSASAYLDANGVGTASVIGRVDGVSRWQLQMSGGAGTKDLFLSRFDAAGNYASSPIRVNYESGLVSFQNAVADLTVQNNVYVGGTGNGRVLFQDGGGVEIGEMGVGVSTGFGDSVGIYASLGTGSVVIGVNGATRFTIQSNGSCVLANELRIAGHQTTAAAANVNMSSDGWVYRSTSSLRYKKDIRDLTDAQSEAIYALRPVSYHSKSEVDDPEQLFYGLIAEEVAEHCPQVVSMIQLQEGGPLVPDGVQYERLIPLMLAELAKLRARVAQLEAMLQV